MVIEYIVNNFYVVYFKVERSGEGGDAMDYWYYRSHDDSPGTNSYIYDLMHTRSKNIKDII